MPPHGLPSAADVVDVWRDAGPGQWFNGGAAFDALCRERFHDAHMAAARGLFESWMHEAQGALALQILLDQLPRNLFRDSAHAFATDGLALRYARQALERGLDAAVEPALRVFMYLAFEHHEDLADQHLAVRKIQPLGNDEFTHYAYAHLKVIERFGRFPHRNRVLGRTNTAQEQAYLDAGGGF